MQHCTMINWMNHDHAGEGRTQGSVRALWGSSPVAAVRAGAILLLTMLSSACGDFAAPEGNAGELTALAERALAEDGPVSEEVEAAMVAAAEREAALASTLRERTAPSPASSLAPPLADGSGYGCTTGHEPAPVVGFALRPLIRETERHHRGEESVAALLLAPTDDETWLEENLAAIHGSLEELGARRAAYLPGQHAMAPEELVEAANRLGDAELEVARQKFAQLLADNGEAR